MRRHILHIAYTNYSADPRVRRQCEALRDAGWDVSVMSLANDGEPPEAVVDGVAVYRREMPRYRGSGLGSYLSSYLAFIRWAFVETWKRRKDFDIVQVHTAPDFAVVAGLPARMAGLPLVLDIHDLTPELFAERFADRGAWGIRALEASERFSVGLATHVMTVSETFRKRLVARGLDADKVTIIMNLPDEHIFWRDEIPPPPDEPVLSYHGTLVPRYGTDILLDAAALLVEEFPTLTVKMIGDGDQRDELVARARQPDLAGRVEFSDGRVDTDQIPDTLGAVSVGVVANRQDSFANLVLSGKFIEYLAMGIPVVVAKTEGLLDHFDPDTLSLIETTTPEWTAEAIRPLLRDPVMAREQLTKARTFFADNSWRVEAGRYVAYLEGLIG